MIARALAHPEMQRFSQQVRMISEKLGIPPPQWLSERKPDAGDQDVGS